MKATPVRVTGIPSVTHEQLPAGWSDRKVIAASYRFPVLADSRSSFVLTLQLSKGSIDVNAPFTSKIIFREGRIFPALDHVPFQVPSNEDCKIPCAVAEIVSDVCEMTLLMVA